MKTLQSLLLPAIVVFGITLIVAWRLYMPREIDPPGYREQIQKHATGDNVYSIIQHLDSRPLEDSIE